MWEHHMLRRYLFIGVAVGYVLCAMKAGASELTRLAQLNCAQAQALYDQAHQASAAQKYEDAIRILEQVRTSIPRHCRLESDEGIDRYISNLRSLIAQQQAGGMPRCQPVQTGPTSYSCWTNWK